MICTMRRSICCKTSKLQKSKYRRAKAYRIRKPKRGFCAACGNENHLVSSGKKSIRIAYRIIEDEVVGLGRRADFEVYAEVARRLLKKTRS